MRFHEWTVQHRRSLLFLIVVAISGGVVSILQLPVSLFPHVSFPRIEVSVDAGVRPAPQMEIEVTRKLEQALRSVRFVHNVRSTTSRGSSTFRSTSLGAPTCPWRCWRSRLRWA